MKKYLMVENTGELPQQCVTYIGTSTKRNDSEAIGQFGSGLKFGSTLALSLSHKHTPRMVRNTASTPLPMSLIITAAAIQVLNAGKKSKHPSPPIWD